MGANELERWRAVAADSGRPLAWKAALMAAVETAERRESGLAESADRASAPNGDTGPAVVALAGVFGVDGMDDVLRRCGRRL